MIYTLSHLILRFMLVLRNKFKKKMCFSSSLSPDIAPQVMTKADLVEDSFVVLGPGDV